MIRTQTTKNLKKDIMKIMRDSSDEKQWSIDELIEALSNKGIVIDVDYNRNQIGGALYSLKRSKLILCLERGIYGINSHLKFDEFIMDFPDSQERLFISEQFLKLSNNVYDYFYDYLKNGIILIKKEVNDLDVSDMNTLEWNELNKILQCKKTFEQLLFFMNNMKKSLPDDTNIEADELLDENQSNIISNCHEVDEEHTGVDM